MAEAAERTEAGEVDASEEIPGMAEACRRFPMPDAELAQHVLRELGWDDRFVVSRMVPSKGGSDLYLYSLRNAAIYLLDKDAASASMRSKGLIKLVDIDGFVAWLRSSVEDAVLADAIEEELADAESYNDRLQVVQMLVGLRMIQLGGL